MNHKTSFFLTLSILSLITLPITPLHAYQQPTNPILVNPQLQHYQESTSITITYTTPEITLSTIDTPQETFTIISHPYPSYLQEPGQPQLPQHPVIIAMPTETIHYEITDYTLRETIPITNPLPALAPQPDTNEQQTTAPSIITTVSQQNNIFPTTPVKIHAIGKIRDIPFAHLIFYPVQYNPIDKTITIYESVTIQLTYPETDTIPVHQEALNSPFKNLYQSMFINWPTYHEHYRFQPIQPTNQEPGCDLLIITHPDFKSAAQNLATWRHQSGIKTTLVTTAKTGSTAEEIQQYIQNAYTTWNPPPTYILLIGDSEWVPTNLDTSIPTDLYYTTVDGSDYYPDIFIGRLPADTLSEAEIMINKILEYDQTPPQTTHYYQNMLVAAYFQDNDYDHYEDRRFVLTSEEIRDWLQSINYICERIYCTHEDITPTHYNDGYYANGEPLPEELLRSNNFTWDGNADDIISAINQGVFIANHRDHGSYEGWGDPRFIIENLVDLTNNHLYPVVFSINCQSGGFHDEESFCEELLRLPNAGAVATYGASVVSYSGYNDYLCRGFYDAIWPNFDPIIGSDTSISQLGPILNYGKLYMTQTWGDPWNIQRDTYEMFHLFCDPTQTIRTMKPEEFTVSHPTLLSYGSNSHDIYVEINGTPIKDAQVCIMQENGFYTRALTNESGVAHIEFNVEYPYETTLTVTTPNTIPYQTTIPVNNTLPALIIESLSGGLLTTTTRITNIGGVTAQDITWDITLEGGLILLGKVTRGTIPTLEPETSITIDSKPIIGFGKTQITATAVQNEQTAEKTQDATVLLFIVILNNNEQ
ncbi:MAG: hypothetical protein KKG04_03455 [Candidatus Thermoplasmatota archaeon]|nr:hypothetical protein [Candidatus Thermoplasmatota archaeon]